MGTYNSRQGQIWRSLFILTMVNFAVGYTWCHHSKVGLFLLWVSDHIAKPTKTLLIVMSCISWVYLAFLEQFVPSKEKIIS